MFPALADAIDTLDVPVDDHALRAVLVLHDRLAAKVAVAVGEVDHAGLWNATGATSMRAWLRDEGLAGGDALRLEKLGQRLRRLPVLRAAWTGGALSNGQVRAVTAQLTDRNLALFADHEAGLVPTLVGLSVAETDKVMTEWRARADAVLNPPHPAEPERALAHSETLGGRFVTNGTFDNAGGAIIATALAAVDTGDLTVSPPRRRADALVDICQFFLDHHRRALTPRQRPHLALVLDADELANGSPRAELADYRTTLDAATTAMYLCDCSISRVVADKVAGSVSRILDLGRTTDVVSAAQRTALAVRDRNCRYPGCDRPAAWCDAHHVRWWSNGGPTDLDNLVLLCRRHHRLLHRRAGMHAKLLPDATLEITLPNGTTRTTRPPGRPVIALE